MTRVLAVALQKGGVGKTTTTVNLAASIAEFGLKVLVIDLDQQADSTECLGVELGDDDATMWEVLHLDRAERVPLTSIIKASAVPGVDVAPGALALKEMERTGLGPGGQMRLARQLDEITTYDFVLIDCPPALGELTTAALAAADDVLTPISPGPNEIKGLKRLGATVLDVQDELNPDIEIRYLLIAGYDGRTQVSKDIRAMLRRDWGDWEDGGGYVGEVRHTVRVAEATARSMPLAVHAPTSTATEDYRAIAKRIIERVRES
ncbi:ParA family protein [Nocardia sp. NPDC127579]|uniref:ParA family protein n=1 Tax=Nocardia sp. NPDC127579 TaxID=3345402 RepID=UPI003633D05C